MPPQFPSAPQPPVCGFHGPGVVVSEAALRDAVVAAAVAEQTRWFGAGNTLVTEGANGQFGHLVRYWLTQNASIPPATLDAVQTAINTGVAYGQLLINTANDAALQTATRAARASLLASAPTANNPANLNDLIEESLLRAVQSRRDAGSFSAWSGVFVVWCIRSAAIQLQLEVVSSNVHEGIDGLLLASFRHSEYVIEAYDRRFRNPARSGTYHAFNPSERAVKRGDVIVQDRRTPLRINGVTRFADIPGMGRRDLHCDIVTAVRSNEAEAIGGNLGQSVRRRLYPLDANGQLLIVNRRQVYTQENDRRRLPPLPEDRSQLASTSTGRIFALLSPVERCVAAPTPVSVLNVTRGKTVSLREAEKRSPWPMSARQGFTAESFEELESPFLNEEVLQSEPQNTFESGAERLVSESPFTGVVDAPSSLRATSESPFLQGFTENFLSPDEPETHEVGEIEESELWEPFIAESKPGEYEDLATEEEAQYDEENGRGEHQPEMLECSPSADEAQEEEFRKLESDLHELYLDEEETGSEFEDGDTKMPQGVVYDATIVNTKTRAKSTPAEVALIVDRWGNAVAAKVSGVRLKVYECDIGESGRSDAPAAADVQIAEFTLDLGPNPEFVKNPAKATIPRVAVVNAKWANATLEKSYKATTKTDITLWLGKKAFHLWIPRVDIMEEGSAAEIGFVIEDREGHKVERMSIARGQVASVSLPDYLKVMLEIPGRLDDPKRDAAVDMDGTKFDEFLKGKNRREFIQRWFEDHPALKEAANEPGADLKTGDIIKAWFIIHDVSAGASLGDKRYKANQPLTKASAVHGFLNRAGYFAATHDFAKNRQGTVYEYLSKRGMEIAGERTINIETVPDIESGVPDNSDGSHGAPSNAGQYASIGYRRVYVKSADGKTVYYGKKVAYYKWTKTAFDVLADLYIFASARARHLLTITAHKEMDRNLAQSVIWREYSAAKIRSGTGKHWETARNAPSDYHGDPYGFNMQALYDLITQKLNALGGKQMPVGTRYGIHPWRVAKADGENVMNGDTHMHEFPHQSDPNIKTDTGLKKKGWWNS